jgi:hypothetical protein
LPIDQVLDHVDLDAIVDRLPIDRVLDRVDVDAVAARVDLDRAAARLDIASVLQRVDLDGVVAQVDLDAAIERVDLVGIARELIDELDLAEIIRASTGSMASDAVRGVRWQTVSADQAVNSAFARFRPRRGRQQPERSPDPGAGTSAGRDGGENGPFNDQPRPGPW